MIGVVFLDISKAFNTIDHSTLLRKLRKLFSLSDSSCQWVESYLQSREQAVRFAGVLSPTCPITAGVPQGSVLGSTLFSMFINDLSQSIAPVASALFADDTTIFTTGTSVEDIAAKLNSAMSRISSWISKNGLMLNITKTMTMLIRLPSKRPPPLVVSYNDSLIDEVQVFKLLGVFVDQHLKWDHHVNHVATTVSRNVRELMRRLSWTPPQKSLSCFYYTYVIPSLNYCSLVWRSCRKSNLQRLHRLQNLSARIILKLPKPYSATTAINTLQWRTLEEYQDVKVLKLARSLVNHATATCPPPTYLSDLIQPVSKSHSYFTSGAQINRLSLPIARTEFGRKAPSFLIARAWNSSL